MMNDLAKEERCVELDAKQIDSLRTLPVAWDPIMESGMVELDLTPLTHGSLFGSWLGSAFRKKEEKQALESIFQIFLAFGTLDPGNYPLKSGEVVDADPDVDAKYQLPHRASFDLTAKHLKLLRAASGEWWDGADTLVIDPKRPFGNMSYFEIDMAEILGMPLRRDAKGDPKIPPEQQKIFDQLYSEMPFALKVFLKNAVVPAGKYCRKPAGWGPWRKVR